ncbi:unnamed protein product [Moneuplotes crassus]|uniref:Uncharacterized protein n=1 Tax=Euplotes crassus TaxID=5936 RepID=A0AAD2D539_EUPCR|nr:unnamed protein product [Moneuplotes crassus]
MRFRLGQYFNFEGLKFTLSGLFHPSLYRPHYQISTISEINFYKLRKNGIKYIVFDKDNTLTLPYEKKFHPAILPCITALVDPASAGADSPSPYPYGINKPRCIEDIRRTFSKNNDGIRDDEICVIGDRIFIDVIMGNSGGFLTIHTQPFTTEGENFLVRGSRKIEDLVVKLMSGTQKEFPKFEKLKQKGTFEEFIIRPDKNVV